MSRAEDAQIRLYESTRVRDELTDEQAEKLLRWAEAEITRLDESGLSDEAFAAKADALMKMLSDVNRFAGRQGQVGAQGASAYPASIADLAAQIDHPLSAAQVVAAATGDPLTTIAAVTALMSAPTAPDAVSPDRSAPISFATPGENDDETHEVATPDQ